jgi:hypothetical protein
MHTYTLTCIHHARRLETHAVMIRTCQYLSIYEHGHLQAGQILAELDRLNLLLASFHVMKQNDRPAAYQCQLCPPARRISWGALESDRSVDVGFIGSAIRMT